MITTEDKQRIYKEVNRIFNESESVDLVHELMFKVGEYATIYERKQQAELRNKVIEECIVEVSTFFDDKDNYLQSALIENLNSLKK